MALKKASTHRAIRAYEDGFADGMFDVLRGGKYGAAPVRIHKSVGSPVTDRMARYGDVMSFKQDVGRAERVVVSKRGAGSRPRVSSK